MYSRRAARHDSVAHDLVTTPDTLHTPALAALALGLFACKVGAGGGVDPPAGDRDDVQRAVELAVAAAVKTVAVASSRGCGDRGDANHPGEVRVTGETLGAGGLPDEDRGAERAAAGLGEQLRPMCTDEIAQLALERLGFPGQRGDALDLLASDANPDRLWQRSEPAGDALQLAGVVELARGALGLELRIEDHEIPPQPVDLSRALGGEDLPVIAKQPDLDGLLVEEG